MKRPGTLIVWGCLLASGCRRQAEAPGREPPRVYEQGDCAAVMTVPGMRGDEVFEGVASMGITAVQNRMRAAKAWTEAHRGHWVRWSLMVNPRDPEQGPEGAPFTRCLEGTARLGLQQLNAPVAAAMRALHGGERVRVEGWLDEWSLALPTTLHVESLEVEAPPAAVVTPVAVAPVVEAPTKPDAPSEGARRRGRHRR